MFSYHLLVGVGMPTPWVVSLSSMPQEIAAAFKQVDEKTGALTFWCEREVGGHPRDLFLDVCICCR